MQPDSTATFSSQAQTPAGASPQSSKVPIRPVAQFLKGLKAFWETNLGPGVIAVFINAAIAAVVNIAMLYAVYRASSNNYFAVGSEQFTHSIGKFIAIAVGIGILIAAVSAYFGSVINRLIITGSRRQKENLGHALAFAAKRFSKAVLTYLFVFGLFLSGFVIVSLSAMINPILTLLLGLAGIIAAIIVALRLLYVPLIIVDDEDPGGPMSIIRRSSALWVKSSGAIFVYWLLWAIVYLVINALVGSGSSSTHKSTNFTATGSTLHLTPTVFTVAIGALIIGAALKTIVQAVAFTGEAAIYNEARGLLGSNTSAPPAPQSNSAPSAVPPTMTPPPNSIG